MLAAINGVLKIVPPIAWAVIVLMLLAGLGVTSFKLDRANTKLGAATAAVLTCKGVNDNNKVAMARVKEINNECIEGREADEALFAKVQLDWEGERSALALKAAEVRRDEIQIYNDPTCAEFAQLNIGDVCPDLVDQLRERAGSRHGVRDQGSEGAGENADTL